LAKELRALDANSSDATEVEGLTLHEYRQYSKDELEEILKPLSRRNKLKYRALNAPSKETGIALAFALAPAPAPCLSDPLTL
jgi:hypothetical protein